MTIRSFITRYLATQGENPGERSIPAECTLRIDKARRELGYELTVTIDAGLATMPRIV